MNNLKELCKQLKDNIKHIPMYCVEQYEEFQKYSELCRLTNAIATLSNSRVARTLDETIKEIAYASLEPNPDIREKYLREAIKDLASGMDVVEVIEKYDKIWASNCRGLRSKIILVDDHSSYYKEIAHNNQDSNPCCDCVYEDVDGSTEDICVCVSCNRMNDFAKNDYYRKK